MVDIYVVVLVIIAFLSTQINYIMYVIKWEQYYIFLKMAGSTILQPFLSLQVALVKYHLHLLPEMRCYGHNHQVFKIF